MTSDGDAAARGDGPGPGGVLGLPVVVAGEVLAAVPRLVGRTRRQVDLARRVAGHLPCAGFLAPPSRGVPVPAHEVAPVDVLSVIADRAAEDDDGATASGPDAGDAGGPAAEGPASPGPAPTADELAVPDYDALSASQVVPRLASLSPAELEAVRAYERAHRNRQTILGRVSQLLEG